MQTILFDWDGTIVDSMGALYETTAATCRHLGLPFDEEIFRRTFSPNWRLKYRALGITEEHDDEAIAIWRETFRADEANPFPGAREALERLRGAGYRLGVVTSGDRDEIEPQLKRIDVDELLTVRVYGNDTVAGKPDPEPLHLALALAGGVPPESAVYVGDALDDVRMAASAGVLGVGIVSMLATDQDLRSAGAVESAGSVAEWADRFLAKSATEGHSP
jgi:HAD superfamily hydrolase (TIGR01549 family)